MASPTFTDPSTLVLHSTTNAATYSLASASPNVGSLYYIGVFVRDTTTSGVAPTSGTLAGTNGWNVTWTKIIDFVQGTAAAEGRMLVFRGLIASSTAGILTYSSVGAETNEGCHIIPIRTDGANTVNPEAQTVREPAVDNTNNAATGGTLTFSSPSPDNSLLVFMGHLTNEAHTAEAGWTKYGDGNFLTPSSALCAMVKTGNADVTASATWTTSSRWVAAGIEVRGATVPPSIKRNPMPVFIAQ